LAAAHRPAPSSEAGSSSTSGPSADPRTALFFPADVYRPVEYVRQLCSKDGLPEEVCEAIVKAISSGKGVLSAKVLAAHVSNAKGIISMLQPQVALPVISR
jgi:hypothetical protein